MTGQDGTVSSVTDKLKKLRVAVAGRKRHPQPTDPVASGSYPGRPTTTVDGARPPSSFPPNGQPSRVQPPPQPAHPSRPHPEHLRIPPADPYAELRAWDGHENGGRYGAEAQMSDGERERVEEGYEWEHDTDEGSMAEGLVPPSLPAESGRGERRLLGLLAGSSSRITLPSPTVAPGSKSTPQASIYTGADITQYSSARSAADVLQLPTRPSLTPEDSYQLLLDYQTYTTSTSANAASSPNIGARTPKRASWISDRSPRPDAAQWHEMIDASVIESLDRKEVKRQGLWWEVIGGEKGYVEDLKIFEEAFIGGIKEHQPPLIQPEEKLQAFLIEISSTMREIAAAHERLVSRLQERQRNEWPFMITATDLVLHTFLEAGDLYETYIKNYPFAESRVKREIQRNPAFRKFLIDRGANEATRRRDITIFLSRPVTRLPRLRLLLETILSNTPADHPDTEEIPTAIQVLTGIIKSSQPGIESAESKIKLWDTAEKLLFRKGEVIELDVAEPKRALVHSGTMYRRVKSDTNWHGWQDLHVVLLDNYLLLTRDINGKHVVVSRPIPIDFLSIESVDGAPERRADDFWENRRRSIGHSDPAAPAERLMFPLTISVSFGEARKYYTLCTESAAARAEWEEKIKGAQTLRHYDLEGNKLFAVHHIAGPPSIRNQVTAADTVTWLGRETVAMATERSVWIGWRHDTQSFRELVRFTTAPIISIALVTQFGWVLVLNAGTLFVFRLDEMMPTYDTSTWRGKEPTRRNMMSEHGDVIDFVRVGTTKDRLLVVYGSRKRTGNSTKLTMIEPLLPAAHTPSDTPYRHFATCTVAGRVTDVSFLRQTLSVITDKHIVIVEPGSTESHAVPTFTIAVPYTSAVARLISTARPVNMFQVGEGEFLIVYDWGGCHVDKTCFSFLPLLNLGTTPVPLDGEIIRRGEYIRWNLSPRYASYRAPHLLLFDDAGHVEVRDVTTAKMCEVIKANDERWGAIRTVVPSHGVLALGREGLGEIVETFEL